MRIIEWQSGVWAGCDRKDTSPEIANDMVAPVLDSQEKQISFAALSRIPISHYGTSPSDLIDVDCLSWFNAAKNHFNVHAPPEYFPVVIIH